MVSLRQFDLLRSVGRGAFGKVRIVRKKSDKKLFALKYINKEKCIAQKAVRNTIFERELLESLEHPLIVNLRYAFQDDENMFMVLDLMLGGDMKYHLEQTGTFPEEAVKVYAAEIICAISYLHKRGVVHRDIKPDNLLLDATGHIHLTDFNVATFLPHDNSQLKSFSGTLTYMAPEVIQRDGYGEEIDWWSMGIVLYELLYGKRPFRGRTSKELANQIIKGSLRFPITKDVSDECIDFIAKLLEKKLIKRLGHGGVEEIRTHPFLSTIDWSKVELKQLSPVFVPDSKRPNFNAIFEAEDVLVEDKPLKKSSLGHKRAPKSDDEEYIQTAFRSFDYQNHDLVKNNYQDELIKGAQIVERQRHQKETEEMLDSSKQSTHSDSLGDPIESEDNSTTNSTR